MPREKKDYTLTLTDNRKNISVSVDVFQEDYENAEKDERDGTGQAILTGLRKQFEGFCELGKPEVKLIGNKVHLSLVPRWNSVRGIVLVLREGDPAGKFMYSDIVEGQTDYELPKDFDVSRILSVKLNLHG